MDPVLAEITVTYELLLDMLQQQQRGVSLPATDEFRDELIALVKQSITASAAITKATEDLARISNEASKQPIIRLSDSNTLT